MAVCRIFQPGYVRSLLVLILMLLEAEMQHVPYHSGGYLMAGGHCIDAHKT